MDMEINVKLPAAALPPDMKYKENWLAAAPLAKDGMERLLPVAALPEKNGMAEMPPELSDLEQSDR